VKLKRTAACFSEVRRRLWFGSWRPETAVRWSRYRPKVLIRLMVTTEKATGRIFVFSFRTRIPQTWPEFGMWICTLTVNAEYRRVDDDKLSCSGWESDPNRKRTRLTVRQFGLLPSFDEQIVAKCRSVDLSNLTKRTRNILGEVNSIISFSYWPQYWWCPKNGLASVHVITLRNPRSRGLTYCFLSLF